MLRWLCSRLSFAERDSLALSMTSRLRIPVTTALVSYLLFASGLAAGQLVCPPVTSSSKEDVTICAVQQEKDGSIFKLHGRSKITYRDFTLWADEATYDSDTGVVTLNGHVILDGAENNEHVQATHGTYNVRDESGRFYDATGTIGSPPRSPHLLLTTTNPFAFTGKVVVKAGPDHYVVYDGIITSCTLPQPKWQFKTQRAVVTAGGNATVYWSTFRIRNVPVFYLPVATHPVDPAHRKSGLLMPSVGLSNQKGTILGGGFYWAINRSMDAWMSAELFSRRGWAQHGEFRVRPSNDSYLNLTYFGVVDRGVGTPKVSQGGEEVRLYGEDRLFKNSRGVVNIDYLSSFLFRLAFVPQFYQAVQSEVKSQAFLSNTTHGFSYNALLERYQSFQDATRGDVITIHHLPSFEVSSVDRPLGRSPFYWTLETAIEGLSRSEPLFRTGHAVGRLDTNPSISLPVLFRGWSLRPELGIHYTLYSQQLVPSSGLGTASSDPINRRALDASVEFRPPALEQTFEHRVLGRRLKHVIEPRILYRKVSGVDNFSNILRFDERDILSNTNEVEYAVVNRLYSKRNSSSTENCGTAGLSSSSVPNTVEQSGTPSWEDRESGEGPQLVPHAAPRHDCPVPSAREFISWELAQKYFLDTNFGGALINGRRNVLESSADFTAFAYLTSPRHLSPLISRLRTDPTSNLGAEWDVDYDFTGRRINASTALLNYRVGQVNFGAADAFLYLPGEILASNNIGPVHYHQFRVLAQYGNTNKRGLSGAGAFGFDVHSGRLQYTVFQSTYNWDCCGITAEYARVAIGSIRNENQYRFTYSLANIGSLGNLLRKERLY
jgi:LPS-assembly protein